MRDVPQHEGSPCCACASCRWLEIQPQSATRLPCLHQKDFSCLRQQIAEIARHMGQLGDSCSDMAHLLPEAMPVESPARAAALPEESCQQLAGCRLHRQRLLELLLLEAQSGCQTLQRLSQLQRRWQLRPVQQAPPCLICCLAQQLHWLLHASLQCLACCSANPLRAVLQSDLAAALLVLMAAALAGCLVC